MHDIVAEIGFWLRVAGAVAFVVILAAGLYVGCRMKKTSK